MTISVLFERGFEEYSKCIQDHKQKPWLFFHIPRTAGTSLWVDLDRVFPANMNIFLESYEYGEGLDYHDALTEKFRRNALAGLQNGELKFVGGHLNYGSLVSSVRDLQGFRLMTILRHPVDRIISEYRYSCSATHPDCVKFMRLYPRFEDFLSDQAECNKMHTYLCETPEEDAQVLVERLGRTFGFVGLQNLYGLSHQIFFAANGAGLQPTQRLNAMDEKSAPVANFSHLNELIEARNSKDMTIYLHFERLYKNNQDRLWKALGSA